MMNGHFSSKNMVGYTSPSFRRNTSCAELSYFNSYKELTVWPNEDDVMTCQCRIQYKRAEVNKCMRFEVGVLKAFLEVMGPLQSKGLA